MIEFIAGKLGVDESAIRRTIGGYQNHVYRIKGDAESIVRLRSSDERTIGEIQEELAFIDHLSEGGVSVARPLKQRDGSFIQTWEKEETLFYAVQFERAKGSFMRVLDDRHWNDAFFCRWGEYIGHMHKAAADFPIQHRTGRNSGNHDPDDVAAKLPEPLSARYTEKLRRFDSPLFDGGIQMIHHDFHQGNLYTDGMDITAFDFDDCMADYPMYDVAVSLYHGIWQGRSFRPDEKELPLRLFNGLLEGYEKEWKLPAQAKEQILFLLEIRDAFLYPIFRNRWQGTKWQQEFLARQYHRLKTGEPYAPELVK